MGNFARLLDPHEARTRNTPADRTSGRKRRDAGFSLIEIMAGMAIIAILALAILPQFAKYFERAAVQNLSAEVSNAALTVESDYSLTGKAKYVAANVTASVASVNKSPESALTGTVDATGFGYTIKGTNTAVTNYCVKYVSQGATAGLKVDSKAANPTCS
ncbi:prepilin-type N-terminal cleavage/methylation domain-containing protein [Paenarthrobacter sp. YJN-5]|uniref:prepilin-type N-terminal cleavage/methylation domain-containing protein n=1 Tax=unclassified Paenarthrobacter TaxID=2634190 RepID=UPI0018785C9D|nr:prepilin-type N-terminal cleavage/methylation domain-containing protein [Paenarthrobacter sp. YJN-5]QOT19467.1 prepilin-type N-terminal cleavage/methylation domain-containing protein [Paenarthrobacter sp. YJN-5]